MGKVTINLPVISAFPLNTRCPTLRLQITHILARAAHILTPRMRMLRLPTQVLQRHLRHHNKLQRPPQRPIFIPIPHPLRKQPTKPQFPPITGQGPRRRGARGQAAWRATCPAMLHRRSTSTQPARSCSLATPKATLETYHLVATCRLASTSTRLNRGL